MGTFTTLVLLIVSFLISMKICSVINKNTAGTQRAYIKRFAFVFVIVFGLLCSIIGGALS